ncbi:MAG: penicillin-binding protein 2 [Clostridia bacterium]|nr:penicillin-binding protein 2 [Clostridia bacterium]
MKRCKILAAVLIISLSVLSMRIFYLSYFSAENAAASASRGTESFGTHRGLILDRNLKSLVEYESETVSSTENPSYVLKIPKRYADNQLCAHIIGYTNYHNEGVCGIEKDYNAYLKAIPNQITLHTFRDAQGNLLAGKGTVTDTSQQCKNSGIRLTIDKSIQQAVERAGKSIRQGCAIVMQSDTGEILASASFPTFNPNRLQQYVNDTQTNPLINRACIPYNVGSVFKVIVCLAALDSGVNINTSFVCRGSIRCGGTVFGCHKAQGHGTINMTQALSYSCNTYFIQLANQIGYQKILSVCERLGIKETISLSDSILAQGGTLPDKKDVSSPAGLANFSFGQGTLLSTPLWLCKVYAAIGNGGYAVTPQLVASKVNAGESVPVGNSVKTRVFSASQAHTLYRMLQYAVKNGTGTAAASEKCIVAGKTATAQTGIYKHGKEKLISYFIGLFSIKSDIYTVLVMCENGSSGSKDCAPVFKEICESICKMQGE